ncbi:MAG: Flp family type IVb pilin [Candidatus Dormibacteria bacterium]
MVEYALILMLVAMAVIVIFMVLGHHVGGLYSNISNGITPARS